VALMKAKRGGRRVVRLRTTFIDADASCPWLGSAWSPIPDQLSDEITDLSNRAASVAVVKFRGLIKQLALPRDKEAKGFFFRCRCDNELRGFPPQCSFQKSSRLWTSGSLVHRDKAKEGGNIVTLWPHLPCCETFTMRMALPTHPRIAVSHSGHSRSAFGNLMMYCAASRSVTRAASGPAI
jgi:hypothetical protein